MNVNIAKKEEKDFDVMNEAIKEAFDDYGDFKDAFDNGYGTIWALKNDKGEILSFFYVAIEDMALTFFSISWVCTPKKHRGKGYATLLLKTLLKDVKKMLDLEDDYECVTIQLICEEKLLPFYTNLGFFSVYKTFDRFYLMLKETVL